MSKKKLGPENGAKELSAKGSGVKTRPGKSNDPRTWVRNGQWLLSEPKKCGEGSSMPINRSEAQA